MTDAQGPERTKVIQEFGPLGAEALGLYHCRIEGAPALSGVSDKHTIILSRSSSVGMACTLGELRLNHTAMAGNLTFIPAAVEWTADAGGTLDNLVVSIPRASFAMAAARADRPSLTIAPRMRGRDGLLWSIVNEMVGASVSPAEPLARWHDLTNELLDHLAASYGVGVGNHRRGFLTPQEVGRINTYLADRLEQTVAVDELADVVAQSASHFPRVFRRTVGLSPHQYVVRLRLSRARELINAGVPLVEAAISSGFVDQSHLSYWVRRIYGTSPARWAAAA